MPSLRNPLRDANTWRGKIARGGFNEEKPNIPWLGDYNTPRVPDRESYTIYIERGLRRWEALIPLSCHAPSACLVVLHQSALNRPHPPSDTRVVRVSRVRYTLPHRYTLVHRWACRLLDSHLLKLLCYDAITWNSLEKANQLLRPLARHFSRHVYPAFFLTQDSGR